jgi:hypothetical protein
MRNTGEWIYFWPNGDRTLITNCYDQDEALLLLDEIGDADTSMLKPIQDRPRAIHFVREIDHIEGDLGLQPSRADEMTMDNIRLCRKPIASKKPSRTTTEALIDCAINYLENVK